MRTITTIDDARQLVSYWTDGYTIQPSAEQLEAVAQALRSHVSGHGDRLTEENDEYRYRGDLAEYSPAHNAAPAFDLDAALADAGY